MSRRPFLAFVLLLAVWGAAFVAGRALDARRTAPVQHERLVALRDDDTQLSVSALVVDPPGPEVFRYAFTKGAWRCVTALGAPAHGGEIGEVVLGLARAHGMPRAFAERELGTVGLMPDQATRVVLLRADGVEVLALDIGNAIEGRTFVRHVGETRVLEIDAAPRTHLDRPAGESLPPLLDRRVFAGTPLDTRLGVRRIFLDRPDGTSLELVPDETAVGEFAWKLFVNGEPAAAPPPAFRVAGWLAFLVRVPYQGFAPLEHAAALGLADPVRLTLIPPDTEPIVLELAATSERSLAPIVNRTSNLTLLVDRERLELFQPTEAMLTDTTLPNPWEAWLRP